MYVRERPIKNEQEYQKLCSDIGIKPTDDNAYVLISKLADDIKSDKSVDGLTINISGSWGIGKTSYTNILKDQLKRECLIIDARSMFYGNFDEYVEGFFSNLYRSVASEFGLKLKELQALSSNITVSLEAGINLGVFSVKTSGSSSRKFKRNPSSDILLSPQSELNTKLQQITPNKILIVLDDIDRLKVDELISALRLVEVLKQLRNVVVVAIGSSRHIGSILESGHIPGAYTYTRKIFDHSIHLTRSLRNTENIIQMMVGNLSGTKIGEAEKKLINEAFYFLITRQIMQNIRLLVTEKNDPANVGGPVQGEFWSTLASADDPKLGSIYREIRGFFNTRGSAANRSGTHAIWGVDGDKIKPIDNTTDPLALLTASNSQLAPWEARNLFRWACSAEYWAQKIVPSPDEEGKISQYIFSEEVGDIMQMYRNLDRSKPLPASMLGAVAPESRWSIVKKTLQNLERNEMDNDRSLPQLNDLRLIHNFSSALAERISKLTALGEEAEREKLQLFVECVESFESIIGIEKGEI